MRRGRSKRKNIPTRYSLLGMTAVCVGAILLSLTLNISGGPLKSVAGYLFVPMQSGINKAGNWLSGKTNDFKKLGAVMEENEQLQTKIDELQTELTSIKLDKYELENLRELLELDEEYASYEKVAASVVAKDSGNWFSTFTINRGSKAGLKEGMNVISKGGLVGIITETGSNYAKVRAIIDDTMNVSAMVTSTGDNFNVSGNLQTMGSSQAITFNELKDEKDKVKVGDSVVTSYISDKYLPGILIGYISSIEENPNNLTKSGTITPVSDFEHIKEVLVITDTKENQE